MDFQRFKILKIKIALSPYSFYWVRTLPAEVNLAKNITPFRKFNKELQIYEANIGEVYFIKSDLINGYWIASIKEYTNFDNLEMEITNKLIYY